MPDIIAERLKDKARGCNNTTVAKALYAVAEVLEEVYAEEKEKFSDVVSKPQFQSETE